MEEQQTEVALSFGQNRIRTFQNSANDPYIEEIKRKGADLLDFIEGSHGSPKMDARATGDYGRLKSLAYTAIEEGVSRAIQAAHI